MLKKIITHILFLFITTLYVQAQFVPMRTTTMIHTPYGNAPITTYRNIYMPMYFGKGGVPNKKHDYTVILKNDSVFTGKGKVHIKKGITSLVLKGKGATKEFHPSETKEVYIIAEEGKKVRGIPFFKDSCWLFRVHEGRINEYAIVPELGTLYVSAVQKGEGSPIQKITKENIVSMVNDNPKALKKAKKDKLDVALDIYNSGK